MTLIKSISGIRGTIGGRPGEGLSPLDVVKFTAAYASFIRDTAPSDCSNLIVVGRDARLSGPTVRDLVCATLRSMAFDVVDIDLASTPTTEIAVTGENAAGGIIITASHNPMQWNALKLLNHNGEFLSAEDGAEVLRRAADQDYTFAPVTQLGNLYSNTTYTRRHIEQVLALPLVDRKAIAAADFHIVVDAVNSVGGVIVPQLLRALGVKHITCLNCDPTGHFAHTPEPIPENLTQISTLMARGGNDVGFVVDPDVDRLAIVMENGEMFVEEYTLVAVADYVLSHTPGATVSNLSSSRALADVTASHGCTYSAAAVGEVNVVEKIRQTNAVIGGEGNGGVIYPSYHAGRDAMVGIALFLSHLAHKQMKVSELRATYPPYFIAKHKIELTEQVDVDAILQAVKEHFKGERITDIDGVKIDFADSWVHLRRSNTEPIIRIYAEAHTMEQANDLANRIKQLIAALA